MKLDFVIYIDDFGEEGKNEVSKKEKFEKISDLKNFEAKIPKLLTILNKTNIFEKFDEDCVSTFTARNFLNNTFVHYPLEESNMFIDGAFCKNKFFLNFLVKKKLLVSNQLSCFDEKKEEEIVMVQNSYNYEAYYKSLPTVMEKTGNKFEPHTSNLEFNKIHNEVN